MKNRLDRKYLKYVLYVALTATLIFISYNVVFNFKEVFSNITSTINSLFSMISPLIIGCIIAYLLYPLSKIINAFLVKHLKLKYKPHLISIILTYLVVILLFIILIYSIYAMIGGQISHNETLSVMFETISDYIKRYNELYDYINRKITQSGLSLDIKGYLSQAIQQIYSYLSLSINSTIKIFAGISNSIINSFIGLFISFYLLKDYEFFKKIYLNYVSLIMKESKFKSLNKTLLEINYIVSRFIRGQLLDGLIVGLISSIGLSFVGIDFAILIGFTAGIANIIPYVGPLIGCIPAIIVGILSPNPMQALWAVLLLLAVQQLDGAVISPKIVGDSMGLHPIFIIMAITIGGSLAGIIGMLLSVPIAGIIKLFLIKIIRKRTDETSSEV
ncbi:AI-2E family transporter [Clostridium sp. CM028]|uniref:AI-2E family transporter n=1 Tax=Clostridium TaxID=1485 RepID=UPI0013EE48AD|nr:MULTISPECIES: AI-2E family transporter [Clostridium]MBU3092034.1 AI-2E family transporter [Clostridium sp. CF011]MBW9149031.1 AI-2E family transporter [Clostridium sp. CM028]MBZ9607108.1 AI-2E family transporter [Clostridium estertheticum]WAG71316.1 AI-2E family transporter [Clostridium sp. CF011]WLC62875.1 AI-2E family transporter [Clostridium sp. CM028]